MSDVIESLVVERDCVANEKMKAIQASIFSSCQIPAQVMNGKTMTTMSKCSLEELLSQCNEENRPPTIEFGIVGDEII